jgi:hypothetical protein
MNDTEPNAQPEGAGDAAEGTPLRRRENRPVEVDRRRSNRSGFDIGAALELHLDQYKTRRSMVNLLQQWLTEARGRDQDGQDAEYIAAVERAIDVMGKAPDLETAIIMLQQRY